MIRALSILTAVAALAITAAPVASAGTSKKPPSPTFLDQPKPVTSFKPKAGPSKARVGGTMHVEGVSFGAGKDRGWFTNLEAANDMAVKGPSRQGAILYNGHAGLGANKNHNEGSVRGMVNASGGWDPTLRAAHARRAHVITNLGVKYTM